MEKEDKKPLSPEDQHDEGTPQNDDDSYGEEKETVEPEDSKEPESQGDDIETKFKRVSSKVSKLEKENTDLKGVLPIVEALNRVAYRDKEFKKLVNKKLVEEGVLPEDVLKDLEDIPDPKEENKEKPVDLPDDVKETVSWAQAKRQEEIMREAKFFESFEEDKPEITEGEPQDVSKKRQAIAAVAKMNLDRGMSKEDAFNMAYHQIFKPDKIREDGKLEGYLSAQKAKPSKSGNYSQKENASNVNLTKTQQETARAFGMTPSEYAEISNNPDYGQDIF